MGYVAEGARPFRRCVNANSSAAETVPVLCHGEPVAKVVIEFKGGVLPKRETFWCAPCLAALDVGGVGALVPSAVVSVVSS